MFIRKIISIIILSFMLAECPTGFYEDDCGNCWLPYCYNYVTHDTSYDTTLDECVLLDNTIWVIPGDSGDPYFNNFCDSCPDGFMGDDCGHCWQYFCYTFFAPGLDGDPPHSVYYDLSAEECEEYGFNYYSPDNSSNPYWNSNCEEDVDCNGEIDGYSMVDDCGDCQSAYCYDYVTHEVSFNLPCDGPTEMLIMPDDSSNPYWNSSCEGCLSGDVNNDGSLDVMDVVSIVDYILGSEPIFDLECADISQDGNVDVLDVVSIVEYILGGRIDNNATRAYLNIDNGSVTLDADGFVGAVQMTLIHNDNFSIELTNKAMVADYNTNDNNTTLVIVAPESEELFSASGNFIIDNIVVVNSNEKISAEIPSGLNFSKAYPNPFNPLTKVNIYAHSNHFVNVSVYNIMGKKVSTLYNDNMSAGNHTITWDASNMASGIYFINATGDYKSVIQKVMLIK